jgi:hypothetical protein
VRGRTAAVTATIVVILAAGGGDAAAISTSRTDLVTRYGSLTPREYAVATGAARTEQATVHGTFVSATAIEGREGLGRGPSNTGHNCTSGRVLTVRLIWLADAGFSHGGVPGAPPDGPRKALLLTTDATTGVVCLIGAQYSRVQPRPGETFLYGAGH